MGSSITAHVAFGWIMPESDCAWHPLHKDCKKDDEYDCWECQHEDEDDIEDAIVLAAGGVKAKYPYGDDGNYLPGIDKDSPEIYAYHSERRQIINDFGFGIEFGYDGNSYGGENGTIAYLKDTEQNVYWSAEPLSLADLPDDAEAVMRAEAARIGMELPDVPAAWIVWPHYG